MEELVTLLTSLKTTMDSLQLQLTDAKAAVELQVKQSYDIGFAAGVASVVVVPPVDAKIYSQEDLDKAVLDAILPLQTKILELDALVAGVDAKIAEGVSLVKADLLAKYLELQVSETMAETGFAELLK